MIHTRWSKSSLKHSIRFCGIFPSLKQDFMAYRSSKVSDCIFEIHQLWQSGFSRVYSNCCCRCSFEAEILKIGQSSHNMYSNNILNFQESTIILNACTKKVWKFIECTTYLSSFLNPESQIDILQSFVIDKNKCFQMNLTSHVLEKLFLQGYATYWYDWYDKKKKWN